MAHGLMEMKEAAAAKHSSLYDVESRIQYFLDRFYLMRISIRLLIHQHCESPLYSEKFMYKLLLYQSPHTHSLLSRRSDLQFRRIILAGAKILGKSFVKVYKLMHIRNHYQYVR